MGTAPFYWDWPVNVYVEEADGTTVEAQPLALSLPDLLPGGCQTVKTKLAGVPGRWWEEQDRRITLGIVDPMTGRDAVRFAMQTGAGGRPHRPLCGRIEPKKPETLQKRPQAFWAADAAIRNIGNGEWQKITGCAPG